MPPKLEGEHHHLHLLVHVALLKQVDVWRGRQDGVPTRSDAIRQLLELGLEHAKKGGKHSR